VTFEDDAGAYDQKDAQGFIQLNALRLKLLALLSEGRSRPTSKRPFIRVTSLHTASARALTWRRNARFSISSSSRSSRDLGADILVERISPPAT
jgi:hypothetical protein